MAFATASREPGLPVAFWASRVSCALTRHILVSFAGYVFVFGFSALS